MYWLLSGIALFTVIHLTASALPSLRRSVREAIGHTTYRAVFAVLAIIGFVLIVVGWRSVTPIAIYSPPAWGPTLALPLMFVAVILFGAAHARTNIKRIVRHPQLTSIVLWSIAHLAANGDSRSLILFGSLGVWAAIEIALINRRDGEWLKPDRATMRNELIGAAVGVVVFLVLFALHP